mgnify:CR=1 FL=1
MSQEQDARGVNESETYQYDYRQSEKIRQIMAHKEAKIREEEEDESMKNDINGDILAEADEEERLAGIVSAESAPMSLLAPKGIGYEPYSLGAGPVMGTTAVPIGRSNPPMIEYGPPGSFIGGPGGSAQYPQRMPSAAPMR